MAKKSGQFYRLVLSAFGRWGSELKKKESGEWFCATQRLRECQTRAERYRRTSVRRTNLVLSYVLYNGFRMIIIWNMMVQCTINFVHTHAMNSTHTDNERTHTVFGGHNKLYHYIQMYLVFKFLNFNKKIIYDIFFVVLFSSGRYSTGGTEHHLFFY